MSKGLVVTLGMVGILVIGLFVIGSMVVGTFNTEAALRVTLENKMTDNRSEFDNMWKKISQVAQVTEGQKEAIKEILIGYADARSQGRDGDGSFINALRVARSASV